MNTFHSFCLGLIQGITEFVPISSSGHLILLPWFFKWPDPGLAFDVFLHLGTLAAVFLYFFKDWMGLIRAGLLSIIERRIGFERERMLFWLIVIATIPGVLLGLVLHKMAEETLREPLLVAATLAFVGFLMYWIDGRYAGHKTIDELRISDAIWIGIAQSCALIPGVSRSGATITMARLLGVTRDAAARFSFLMSFPITLGATLYEGKKVLQQVDLGLSWNYLLTGLGASTVFGLLSIHFMLTYLRTSNLALFAWYRVLLGATVVGFCLLGHG